MTTKAKQHDIFDMVGTVYAYTAMALIICIIAFIITVCAKDGYKVLSFEFLTAPPNASARASDFQEESGGILTPLVGTVILTVMGIGIAFPFSLGTAIYLCFYAKKGVFRTLVKTAVDILAGVPTVVIGLFALVIFTMPQMGFLSTLIEGVEGANRAFGRSFLVAGITMAIMVLPFVIKSMEEALKSVPSSYIDAAYALGASKWRTIYKVALNSARSGLMTGVILGMGRIIGDTAIVWLALGGSIRMSGPKPWYMPGNWLAILRGSGSTLTSYIFYASPAGEGNKYDVAFGASLVLIVIIIVLNIVVSVVGKVGAQGHE